MRKMHVFTYNSVPVSEVGIENMGVYTRALAGGDIL